MNIFAPKQPLTWENEKEILLGLTQHLAAIQNKNELPKLIHELSLALSNILASEALQAVDGITDNEKTSQSFDDIVGRSAGMLKVFQLVSQVAATTTSVLLLGETGTGKELIARALHNGSTRKDKPMVRVNCAALAPTLIESELFGHEKGSFTGATDRRIGKFELADTGTLFLDEAGELPLELQAKLLRALQEKEIERIGGRTTIKVDVRIIVATNRDLKKEVRSGNFRSDLYYRLNVFPIVLPPLRDRKEDLAGLIAHFLQKHSKPGKDAMQFSSKVFEQLVAYDWPGNVRELEHLVERSVLTSKSSLIRHINLPEAGSGDFRRLLPDAHFPTIEEVEREHIISVLKACNGRVSGMGGAAEKLRIPPTTLASKIRRLKICKGYLNK